jgi:hypothetical protein
MYVFAAYAQGTYHDTNRCPPELDHRCDYADTDG